jgi:arylformamidase
MQYRLAHHPDRDSTYREYAMSSQAMKAAFSCSVLQYGTGPRQHLEFFAGQPGKPLFIFIHGGYWRGLEAGTFSFVGRRLADEGVHFANIEYPLAPTMSMTSIAREAHRGVARAMAEAAAVGADVEACVVSGHSAGGHLAALLPSLHRLLPELTPLNIAGTLPISGLFELEPLRHIGLNDTLSMDQHEARALSPAAWSSESLPPSIVAVGERETDEFRRQSIDYVDQLLGAGNSAQVLLVPQTNHFTVLRGFEDPQSSLCRASRTLLTRRALA